MAAPVKHLKRNDLLPLMASLINGSPKTTWLSKDGAFLLNALLPNSETLKLWVSFIRFISKTLTPVKVPLWAVPSAK